MATNDLTLISTADLMREAGDAYRQVNSNNTNTDWPIWFADYLVETMSGLFDMTFERSQLVTCLMDAENERITQNIETDWPRYYAEYFVERYLRSDTPTQDVLSLYVIPTCPFCRLVINTIDRLHVDIEIRDITSNKHHYQELLAARQRGTVPVLHIVSPDLSVRWMPESRDIVQYLESMYERKADA